MADSAAPAVEVIATSEDGLIVGLGRRTRPWFGVQFHPESVMTPLGAVVLANFPAPEGPVNAGHGLTWPAPVLNMVPQMLVGSFYFVGAVDFPYAYAHGAPSAHGGTG